MLQANILRVIVHIKYTHRAFFSRFEYVAYLGRGACALQAISCAPNRGQRPTTKYKITFVCAHATSNDETTGFLAGDAFGTEYRSHPQCVSAFRPSSSRMCARDYKAPCLCFCARARIILAQLDFEEFSHSLLMRCVRTSAHSPHQ